MLSRKRRSIGRLLTSYAPGFGYTSDLLIYTYLRRVEIGGWKSFQGYEVQSRRMFMSVHAIESQGAAILINWYHEKVKGITSRLSRNGIKRGVGLRKVGR